MNEIKAIETITQIVIEEVMSLMSWPKEKAVEWVNTPNPNLGHYTPYVLINMHRGSVVVDFIKAAKEGY